jgi:integrase
MAYELHREFKHGVLVRLRIGLDLVDEYLEFLRCRCRPNTWINYAHDLKIFFNFIDKQVPEVTTADVFRFIECQHQPDARGLCTRTVKRRLCTLSGLYRYLLTRGDTPVRANPVPGGLPRRSSSPGGATRSDPLLLAPSTLPRIVPVEQVQRFLASLNTYRDKAIILLMVMGGLRKSEALGLQLDDLNSAQHSVRVRRGKGGRERVCFVAPLFFDILERYLRQERPTVEHADLFLVLKGPRRGQPLSISGLNTIIAHHRRIARAPDLTCHRLRHTCLTMLRQAGMSLEALQQQAGHRSIDSTRLYLHLSNRQLQEEYLKVSDRLYAASHMEAVNA